MPGLKKEMLDGRKGYLVGAEFFRTKSDVTNRVRGILYSGQLGGAIEGDAREFIVELLRHHKSHTKKVGCGIQSITVEANPEFPSMRGFWITRTDGTKADFSFVECISPAPMLTAFKSALRRQVVDQILAFKRTAFSEAEILLCPIKGCLISEGSCHVDHEPPDTFDELVERFVCSEKIDVDAVGLTGGEDGAIGDRLEDQGLGQRWEAFHARNAKLRILSIQANLSDSVKRAGVLRKVKQGI